KSRGLIQQHDQFVYSSFFKSRKDVKGTEELTTGHQSGIQGHAVPDRIQLADHLVEELGMSDNLESKLASESFVADQHYLVSMSPLVLRKEKEVNAHSDQEKSYKEQRTETAQRPARHVH